MSNGSQYEIYADGWKPGKNTESQQRQTSNQDVYVVLRRGGIGGIGGIFTDQESAEMLAAELTHAIVEKHQVQ